MVKQTMRALLCAAAPFTCLAQDVVYDTIPDDTLELQEITIKARPKIKKFDGSSFLPTAEKKASATSGLDLIGKMQIPHISVNPLTGRITLTSGGNLKLFINGVDATDNDIAALRPADIVRIEYHDIPGPRYGNADAAIDIIVRRHESGATLAAETMHAQGSGKWATFGYIAGTCNFGKSSIALNTSFASLQRSNWIRDYDEQWHYPDHTVFRREVGLPVSISQYNTETALNYSLFNESKYHFNARLGMIYSIVPNKEEGDRHTFLTTSESDMPTEIMEHTRENELSPSLSLFYRHILSASQSLTIDISGLYMQSQSHHIYTEGTTQAPPVEIIANVDGLKYATHCEARYENRHGSSTFTAGARYDFDRTNNRYTGSSDADALLLRHTSSLFGEYTLNLTRWSASAALAATYHHNRQARVATSDYTLCPSVKASYSPIADLRLRYSVGIDRAQPPISAMNDVEQIIQPGFARRGNPDIKPFTIINQRLSVGYEHTLFSAEAQLDYRREHSPAMSTTFYDGNRFVTTYENHRRFCELQAGIDFTLRPWGEHLSITLSPLLRRFFSYGNTYTHIRNIFHLGANISFNYGPWIFDGNIMTGGANSMYGEELIHEKDMNMITMGYKQQQWSIQAGVFNAFMNTYWMKSENLSALTPYESTAHCNRNTYALIKLSLNLDFGHPHRLPDTVHPVGQPDAGIMGSEK